MTAEDLGEYYVDGVFVTNKKGPVSQNPDGVAILWESIEAGKVKFLGNKKNQEVEIRGTPDWVMEVVSDGSVANDNKLLRHAYHRAGIPEYWLIDARGKEVAFEILGWRKSGYVAAKTANEWHHSKVFGRMFRLTRKHNRRGAWQYTLEVKNENVE